MRLICYAVLCTITVGCGGKGTTTKSTATPASNQPSPSDLAMQQRVAELERQLREQKAAEQEHEEQHRTEAQRQQRLREMQAEADRLGKIVAEEKAKRAAAEAEFNSLPQIHKESALNVAKKLKAGEELNFVETRLLLDHFIIFDSELARNLVAKLAANVNTGFPAFCKNLGLPDGDYLRDRAVFYMLLPSYAMPGRPAASGQLMAGTVAMKIREKGVAGLDPISKQFVQDNPDLFAPPPQR